MKPLALPNSTEAPRKRKREGSPQAHILSDDSGSDASDSGLSDFIEELGGIIERERAQGEHLHLTQDLQ